MTINAKKHISNYGEHVAKISADLKISKHKMALIWKNIQIQWLFAVQLHL